MPLCNKDMGSECPNEGDMYELRCAGAPSSLDEGRPRNRTLVFLDKGNLVRVKESVQQRVNREKHATFQ